MDPNPRVCFRVILSAVAILLLAVLRAPAQTTGIAPRITQAIDENNLVALPGAVHPLTRGAVDLGAVSDAQPLTRMLLLLKRSPDQETALLRLLDEQHTQSSASYHQWLTPEQFGQQFGPADADIQAITGWLQSQGFQVTQITKGRAVIEFSGNVAQVRNALHTQIHRYSVNGEEHMANASDPQIPAALSPIVAGVVTLHNFPHKWHGHYVGEFRRSLKTGETTPLFTFPRPSGNGTVYALGPADFATIYNVAPLWNATPPVDGTGQTIAIVGETNINLQDVRDFRTIFGLPPNDPEIIVNGMDPGITSKGEESEADLDVQWSGAVAKNAKIKYVVSASTPASLGVNLSALYIVENNLASVMSESYGECEQHMTAAENQFYNNIWKQAAAQGITAIVSTGDGGSAGCDNFDTQQTATNGLAVNGLGSTPFNISAGGTDFDQINKWTQFWKPQSGNDPITQASALSYIPEIPWNETCAQLGLNGCGANAPQGSLNILAGSGGPSTLYSKPTWQMGVPGMPNDNKRDLPDVSLFASAGFTDSTYIICQQDQNLTGDPSCNLNLSSGYLDFHGAGGTSAAAPAFAGIMALVNQKTGSRQGNANYVLYALAKKQNANCDASLPATITNTACVFYDVTKGNSYSLLAPGVGTNSVPCTGGSLNCSSSTANVNGVLVDPAKTTTEAWTVGAGYDRATGLGSVNASNLATNWASASSLATKTTLSLSPTTGITHGQNENVSVTVGVTPGSGTGQPTGDVSLIATLQDGITTLGLDSFTLSSGAVSGQKTQSLPGGTYQVAAHYAGDGTFAPSDSSQVSVTVGQEGSQTFIVVPQVDLQTGNLISGNVSSLAYGSTYIIRMYAANSSATANPSGPPSPLCADVNLMTCPTGAVTLTDNGSPLDAGTYSLNNAGYTRDIRPFLAGGTHQLSAQYSGDSSYKPSTSVADIITITPAPSQTQVYVPYLNLIGQSVLVQAGVTIPVYGGVAPSGTFTFYDGNTVLPGQVTTTAFAGGQYLYPTINGYITTVLSSPGARNITATYSGDTNYASSTSRVANVLAQYPVTINVSVDSSTILYGTPVNITATIVTNNAAPQLTGNVTFSVQINGTVTTSLTTDASGNQVLKATASATLQSSQYIYVYFSGSPNYADNSSGVFVAVNIPDFSLSIPSSPFMIGAGQSGTLQISVVPATNNASPVTLWCSGNLPIGYSCSVQPATVNLANGATATATLTLSPPPSATTVTSRAMSLKHSSMFPLGPSTFWPVSLLSGLASLLVLVWRGRLRRLRAALELGAVCTIIFVLGCGAGASFGGGGGGGGTLPQATSTTVASSSSKVAAGTSVTLTAKVTGINKPSGSVTFWNGGSWLGNAILGTDGAAPLTTTLPFPGICGITATYSGDTLNLTSTSPAVQELITGSTVMQVNAQTSTLFHSANVTVTLQ